MAVYDPVTAEAMAARTAVEFCKEVGIYDVFLEGDSLLVVKAVKSTQPNWLPYGQVIDDIKSMLRSLRRWSIRHVKREANSAAHGLAKFATRGSHLAGGATWLYFGHSYFRADGSIFVRLRPVFSYYF
jgi:ribonuclease HI